MEIIYNTTIIILTILAVINVWGILGVLIIGLAGRRSINPALFIFWPAILIEEAVCIVKNWLDKQ